MISGNIKDYNIAAIVEKSGLLDIETANKYYIFGLAQNKPYNMVFKYKTEFWPANRNVHPLYFQSFCASNSLILRIFKDNFYKAKDDSLVKIGLRYDLRKHTLFSANLLKTMIYLFEGKIDLVDFDFRKVIKNRPVFD